MRSIPTITKNLLIINILAFLATYILANKGTELNLIFGLFYFQEPQFHIYQFFTYMFMHGGWAHLFFNMFALWMFGCVMEQVWGPKKFLFYYIVCGLGAGLVQELAQYFLEANYGYTVGASGAIYGILLAFGMTFPEERIFIFPLPVPIKAKWFVMFYVVLELVMAQTSSTDGVAHFAHLGGMLFGFLLIRYWERNPNSRFGRSQGRQFFKRMRSNLGGRRQQDDDVAHKTDWDYNADKKETEERIDAILDKIRKNGYASLTEAEKRFLFESSQKNRK